MNIVGSLVALLLALALPAKWVTVGLAAALTFSYYIGAWTSIRLLRRYTIDIHTREITGLYLRLAGIYSLIALPLYFMMGHIPGGNTTKLFVVLMVSGLGYLGLAKTFRIPEVGAAFSLFFKPRH